MAGGEPARRQDSTSDPEAATASDDGLLSRARLGLVAGTERAKSASEHHVSIAVPFRALERNRGLAASVLAGGIAYRLFLWMLPFCLIVGGVLGLSDPDGVEDAVSKGGLPAAMAGAIGDVAQAADSNSWWLLLMGVPLLLWEGYAGAKAFQLIHGLIWHERPGPTRPIVGSLAFSGGICAFIAALSLTWWFRDETTAGHFVVFAVTIVPLAGLWLLVSLYLPHGDASWRTLVPGALLVALSFEVGRGVIVYWLAPKLENSASLYGAFGVVSTILFYMYIAGRVVVTAPILNSAVHDELRRQNPHGADGSSIPAAPGEDGAGHHANDARTAG